MPPATNSLVSAPELLRLLLVDPAHWIWSSETQVELFKVLPHLWNDLEPEGKQSLLSVLLQGPPREMYRQDLTAEEWEDLRSHSVWTRVARLRRSTSGPGPEVLGWLAEIEDNHPEWRLTGEEREDFPTWTESGWGLQTDFSVDSFLALSDDDIVRVLKEHQHNREGLMETWRQAAEQDPPRALRLFDRIRKEQLLDVTVWCQGLAGLRQLSVSVATRTKALGLLQVLPVQLLDDSRIIRAIADSVRTLAEKVDDLLRGPLLLVWDTVLPASFDVGEMKTAERVTAAINHPTGVLAEALLLVLGSRPLERNAGIDEDIRRRLEHLIAARRGSARLGRVLVASRLLLLHDLDPQWARRHVVPLFDWSDREEAAGAWQGFLLSPRVSPSLWESLKEHFLNAFEHLETIGRSAQNLAALLAAVSIEGQDAIPHFHAAQCLRSLDDAGREEVVRWICAKLRGAGAQAATLWRDRIQPWLGGAWPRDLSLRGPRASKQLAYAATLARDAFAEAATCVAPLIDPVDNGRVILQSLEANRLVEAAPSASLELVVALTPTEAPSWFGDLRSFLDRVREANAQLAQDPRFRRLDAIAIRIAR